MALSNEVRSFGISVCCIQPGDIRTGFTDARVKSATGDDVYKGKISTSIARMERDEESGMDPDAVGRFICMVASRKNVKPIYTVGMMYQAACLLNRILPHRIMNFIIRHMYA